MSESINVSAKGLFTNVNDLANAPQGALTEAMNVNIISQGIIEPRRGFLPVASPDLISQVFEYKKQTLALYGASNTLGFLDRNTHSFTNLLAGLTPFTSLRTKAAEANQALFLTSQNGIYKLDNYNSTPVKAGGIKAIHLKTTLSELNPWLANKNQVAYRTTWALTDANNILTIGSPSQKTISANTSGAGRSVNLKIYIPQGVTLKHVYQVYRSAPVTTDLDSLGNNVEPTEEMQMVYSGNITQTDLTNGYVTMSDTVPDSLRRGATLYTSPSQEDSLAANEPPPCAKDITTFKNMIVYANTKSKQRLLIDMLATGFTGVNCQPFSADSVINTVYLNNISNTANLRVGQIVSGPGIPADTKIVETYGTSVQISNAATATQTGAQFEAQDIVVIYNNSYSFSATPLASGKTATYIIQNADGDQTGIQPGQFVQLVQSGVVIFESFVESTAVTTVQDLYTVKTVTFRDIFPSSIALVSVPFTAYKFTQEYRAGSTEDTANHVFKVATSGTAAQNIADTAKSLIAAINENTANTAIYAYSLALINESPGKILLESRDLNFDSFTVSFPTAPTAFQPPLYSGLSNLAKSVADIYKNGVFISKPAQPDAVPLLNFLLIGSADKEILRVIAGKNVCYVIKEDGIWLLDGTSYDNIREYVLDMTKVIVAPDSVALMGDEVYALASIGAIKMNSSGVTPLSIGIDNKLKQLIASCHNLATLAFGVTYETEHQYILSLPSNENDTTNTIQYVYSSYTGAWTNWDRKVSSGLVCKADGKLYFGDAVQPFLQIERKDYNFTDGVDGVVPVNIVSAVDKVVVLDDVSRVSVGDIVRQGNVYATVTYVDTQGVQVILDSVITLTAGSAEVYQGIDSYWQYIPETAAAPGISKRWMTTQTFFSVKAFPFAHISFATEISRDLEAAPPIPGQLAGGWGEVPWGEVAWGGDTSEQFSPVTINVPLEKTRGKILSVRISCKCAYAFFKFNGLEISYNGVSTKGDK